MPLGKAEDRTDPVYGLSAVKHRMSNDLRHPVIFMQVCTEQKGLSPVMYSLFYLNTNLIFTRFHSHCGGGKILNLPKTFLNKKTHMLVLHRALLNNEYRR